MAQFSVHKNRNPRTRVAYPLLVDVQSDLLDELETRVVVPLTRTPALLRKPLARLTPIIEVDGDRYLLMTPQLAGILRSDLAAAVSDVKGQRTAIVSALDMLTTGV